ncbi:MAG TPA: hypothetical protein EYP76_01100 [Thiomicrorhabdus sp.]|nr:hypothetical protein [Thiomicrorhabdus sp.]
MFKKIVGSISFKGLLGLMALFILALFVSIIYHLPVSWLLAQPSVQSQLPDSVTLSPSSGTVWQGRTHVSTPQPVGNLSWELSFWALLVGQASIDLQWQKEQSHLSGALNVPLFSEAGTRSMRDLNGQIDLPLLIQLLNAPGLNNLPIEGVLRLKQIDLSVDFQDPWPEVFTGHLILNKLNVLGNTFPKILITPKLNGDQLIFTIKGEEPGWTLSGNLKVLKNRQYTMNLTVNAETQASMPGWAGLLHQQSPTVAVLNHRGRW